MRGGSRTARMVPWIPARKVGIDEGMKAGLMSLSLFVVNSLRDSCDSRCRNVPSRPSPGPRGSFSPSVRRRRRRRIERVVQRVGSAAASRSAGSISSCNMRPTMQRNVIVPSASGARRMAAGAAFPVPRCPRERERRPRSRDTPPAAAAVRRWRTASDSPGTHQPPSPDALETPPADAHPAAAARSPLRASELSKGDRTRRDCGRVSASAGASGGRGS